ncbi:MAG TPA: ATP-binding cassette domain-containing protein [Streptosporangiaceae bacterium]|nr:ATP-binding cassette domain-containing protein [Streptosporangiaceae bacterium]
MRLDGVSKRYGFRQPWVVREVSLEIKPGGLMRLEGKNGTGKSTLLRVIAGVSLPTRGTVSGRPITGYVPERFPPGLPFSARDYLGHLGRVHGLSAESLPSRIEACLDKLGGLELADVPLRAMSKGMCQKVAIAQALLPGSGLLVLDEAWTGLDAAAKSALDDAVAQRISRGGSVVFVDHDPRRLAHLDAERWRIQDGQAVRVPPADATRDARLVPKARRAARAAPAAPAGRWRHAKHAAGAAGHAGAASPAGGESVVIGVTGVPAGELAGLPWVIATEPDGELMLIEVEPAGSDDVLRKLLAAGDDVHVRHVRRESWKRGNGGQEADVAQ